MTRKLNFWYKVGNHDVSYVNQTLGNEFIHLREAIKERSQLAEPAESLILQVKREADVEYTTLDAEYFQSNCRNSFRTLVNNFGIKKSNPIQVTLPAPPTENQEIQKLRDEVAALKLTQGTSSPTVATSSKSTGIPAQAPSDRIWVHVRGEAIPFKQKHLEGVELVYDLKEVIGNRFKIDVPMDHITIYRGDDKLENGTNVSDLYNQMNNALKVVVYEDIPAITLVVKAQKNIFYLGNQRVKSLEEIQDLIKSVEVLNQFTAKNTIFLGDDKKNLSIQHLVSAQESGFLNITLSDPDVLDTKSEMHKEILQRAFNVDYVDQNGMKNKFLNYLNCKHKTWKNNMNYYIPYSTIFQSSGYGKSRLIKEVAKQIPTIYLCLRDEISTGYPPRTSAGADLFERVLRDLKEGEEWKFLYVLQNAIQCFKEELVKCDNNCEVLWKNQMDKSFCEEVWDKIKTKSSNWKAIFHDDLNHSANFVTDDSTDNVCFLLCIDEARVLIPPTDEQNVSPFRFLRRALRSIKWNGFFVLLLDTLSRISNFAPPKSIDPSCRDTSDTPFKLFYPYFRLTTMDIFKSNNYDREYLNLAKFGRPLYISYLQSCDNDFQAIDKLKNLLRRKLLGGANKFEESNREISSLAILSSVIGLDMSPQSQLASELVASHMATCLSVSEDRERLILTYPSEPLLSEVALEFISDLMFPEILKLFNSSLKKGLVEPGPRGELVGRIILAVVAHKLKVNNKSENSVRKFLEELYHNDSLPKNLEKFSDEFISGTVSFTHFKAVHYVPDNEDLEHLYMRRCSLIMKRNHPGADICIPVRLTTGRYSVIIIQIKNIDTTTSKADKKYPASAKSMLKCDYVFETTDLNSHNEPCLCLYWQLGYNYHFQESPSTVSTRSGKLESNNLYWATFGLTHYKIDNIIEILCDILTSHISPFESEWKVNNEEGDIWDGDDIRIMDSVGYGKYKEEKKK